MTVRRGEGGCSYWELEAGSYVHDSDYDRQHGPEKIGPGHRCPVIELTSDGRIIVYSRDGRTAFTLGRSAARWLGARLIEAAAIDEVTP